MKSIGNDIVALKAINKQRNNDKRFYSKIITASEQTLYQNPQVTAAIPFENYVWLLWSVKESAYKFLKRIDADLIFPPTKIIVQNISIPVKPLSTKMIANEFESDTFCDGFYNGEVIFGTTTLYFKSIIDEELITTIVNDDSSFDNIHFGIQSISDSGSENQSVSVRESLLKKLSSIIPDNDLKIGKSPAGYPVILKDSKELNISVSLAHHEQFTSYCFRANLT